MMDHDALKDLCLRYLDGDLTEQEAQAFDRLIGESEEAALMLARLAINDSRLELSTTLARIQGEAQGPAGHGADDLPAGELRPSIDWERLSHPRQSELAPADTYHLAIKDAAGLLGYLLMESAKTRPAKWLASAAAVVLAAVVVWQVWGPEPTGEDQVSPLPLAVAPQPSIVAVLTAEYDAVWDRRPGDALYAGQRFTLTAGFAQITTRRGAIAILEAPASIELIDSPNAIRLHSGKLVGICETESSKGFLVRTPNMDITDLGTRFGVDATRRHATEAHVFQGEIEVSVQANDLSRTTRGRLVAGQAVRAKAADDGFVSIEQDLSRFAVIGRSGYSVLPIEALAAGVVDLSGEIAWSPAAAFLAVDRRQWATDDRAQVIEELPAFRLPSDVPVTLLEPGSTDGLGASLPSHTIPAGTMVRTYIVLLYPRSDDQKTEASGSILFDGEVLGIATHPSQSRALETMIGDPSRLLTIGPAPQDWMDPLQIAGRPDVVAIDDERRAVTFAYSGWAGGTDAVRVFVRVPDE